MNLITQAYQVVSDLLTALVRLKNNVNAVNESMEAAIPVDHTVIATTSLPTNGALPHLPDLVEPSSRRKARLAR